MDHSSHSVCIVDNGLFTAMAPMLARSFGKVYYTTPTAGPFPKSNDYLVGKGLPGVTRLTDPDEALGMYEKIDLFVFPDLYHPGKQKMLRALGKRVWGSGDAEMLELDRLAMKRHAAKIKLDIGEYVVLKGMTAVEEFVKSHPGWWLKSSRHAKPTGRGNFETCECKSYSEIRFRLDDIRVGLGPEAETTEFIMEKPIPDAIELATDVYTVWGEFPDKGVLGLEAKSKSYLAKVVNYDDYPPGLIEVNEAMSDVFRQTKYANMAAIECRITKDGTAYVLDPCLRRGRPPLCLDELITNWADIIWAGGAGELVQPKFSGVWAAEMLLYCDYAEEHFTPITCPDEYLSNLKLSNYYRKGGEIFVVPQVYRLSGIGSVVAVGATAEAAIKKCREAASHISGHKVTIEDELDACLKQIDGAKAFGVKAFG